MFYLITSVCIQLFAAAKPIFTNNLERKFLHDEDENERALGMELGMKALERCQEVWIVSLRISAGMIVEIRKAQELGIPVKVFTAEGFQEYRGDGEITDNCYADTLDSVID